ncbi:hypothetical protein ASF98_07460 [Arthrobacter sp. Leaf337]|uniref:hypothetical protein n=1 Tax=Arthrobacter sp. Leaf337 TaxID=1736342 RepID=UPI0006FD936F|nr:hypothetical protein [Arthrobacter sp. Leaf337]KQR68477.1 hypothetical protein ASF98_07460 [Arthrobacter sp. Leaf337]
MNLRKVDRRTPGRGRRWTTVLATTGLAVAAVVTWGGISAVSTVATVDAAAHLAAAPGEPLPAPVPASVSGGTAGPTHHDSAARPAGQPEVLPESARNDSTAAGRADEAPGLGNRAEVSLSEAAGAEVGPAAGARRDGRDRSSGLAEQAAVDPAAVLGSGDVSLGGCLPQYGADGQCLPAVPPSQSQHLQDMKSAGMDPGSMAHDWNCAEVREYFPNGIVVRQEGVDPQKLDPNDDGMACGPAD